MNTGFPPRVGLGASVGQVAALAYQNAKSLGADPKYRAGKLRRYRQMALANARRWAKLARAEARS
jgi:hypothetical protein